MHGHLQLLRTRAPEAGASIIAAAAASEILMENENPIPMERGHHEGLPIPHSRTAELLVFPDTAPADANDRGSV